MTQTIFPPAERKGLRSIGDVIGHAQPHSAVDILDTVFAVKKHQQLLLTTITEEHQSCGTSTSSLCNNMIWGTYRKAFLGHITVLRRCGPLLQTLKHGCLFVCCSHKPWKNGWIDQDAIWSVDSGGLKEPCVRWGLDPHAKGQFWGGKGQPIILKYRDSVMSCAKWLNRSTCCLGVDSGGPKKPCIRYGCTLAPPGEHNWTVRMHKQCGLMSNDFDHLLKL